MGGDGRFDRKAKESAVLSLGEAMDAPAGELDDLVRLDWWVWGCGWLEDCGVICGGTGITGGGGGSRLGLGAITVPTEHDLVIWAVYRIRLG